MDLNTIVNGYLLYCHADGKSPRTIRWYTGKLSVFQEYIEQKSDLRAADDLDVQIIRGFIVYLQTEVRADELNPRKPTRKEHLSPYTIQGYVRVLKAFFSWAYREGLIQENPTALVKVPKAPKEIVQTFSPAQVKALLSVIDTSTPTGFRDYCMVLTLLDTGVRLSELANLQLPALDLEQAHFRVIGKGAKERIVPLGASLQKMLWKYVHRFRPEPVHPSIRVLFLTRDGRAIAPGTIYQKVKDYGEKAGIKGIRCSPHTLRHTFAKSFLMNGGDLFTLQKILGHSSLDVVRLYVNLASDDVQVQHRRHSPVDMMKLKV